MISRASRNERLIQISSNLREQIQRFRVIYMKDYSNPENLISEHKYIFDAISRHDVKGPKDTPKFINNQEKSIIKALKNMEK